MAEKISSQEKIEEIKKAADAAKAKKQGQKKPDEEKTKKSDREIVDEIMLARTEDEEDDGPLFTKKYLIGLVVAAVAITAVMLLVINVAFLNPGKDMAKKVARAYERNDAEALVGMLCPDYVSHVEEVTGLNMTAKYKSFLEGFYNAVEPKVGKVNIIEMKITGTVIGKGVGDMKESFEAMGIKGVTKYKQINMNWHIKGTEGETDMKVVIRVFKCSHGWCLDYVDFE